MPLQASPEGFSYHKTRLFSIVDYTTAVHGERTAHRNGICNYSSEMNGGRIEVKRAFVLSDIDDPSNRRG